MIDYIVSPLLLIIRTFKHKFGSSEIREDHTKTLSISKNSVKKIVRHYQSIINAVDNLSDEEEEIDFEVGIGEYENIAGKKGELRLSCNSDFPNVVHIRMFPHDETAPYPGIAFSVNDFKKLFNYDNFAEVLRVMNINFPYLRSDFIETDQESEDDESKKE